jgi:hypothetical protein
MPYLHVNDLNMVYEPVGVGERLIFLHSSYIDSGLSDLLLLSKYGTYAIFRQQ